ncbi:hypothetical protein BDK51DRAFT_38666 [Blyttiomyces helicus]|uniref:Uncharacterized protein n=1 Tax=Blyttiomyces helicus TaxID=388810 RepID=A0A4P9WGL8_9FUNG|nr:hypothetical protein BDK51DRAFT_38666 [Blyttiomyces helicus]|eukprot:RKO91055.1 hypothetical protein BDK51DRAFT_38666 [Blyttiomyces helicus]
MSTVSFKTIVPDVYSVTISVSGPVEATTLSISSMLEATSSSIASTTISGGVGISKVCFRWRVLLLSAPLDSLGAGSAALTSQSLALTSTQDASSSIVRDGLIIDGGVATATSFFLGSAINCSGGLLNSSFVDVTSAADSTGLETGTMITSGGSSICKSLYLGGTWNFLGAVNFSGTVMCLSTLTYSVEVHGGATITQNLTVGGQITLNSVNMWGTLINRNTVDAMSSTSVSAIFSGGVGVGMQLQDKGNITENGDAISTNPNSTVSMFLLLFPEILRTQHLYIQVEAYQSSEQVRSRAM